MLAGWNPFFSVYFLIVLQDFFVLFCFLRCHWGNIQLYMANSKEYNQVWNWNCKTHYFIAESLKLPLILKRNFVLIVLIFKLAFQHCLYLVKIKIHWIFGQFEKILNSQYISKHILPIILYNKPSYTWSEMPSFV